MLVNVYLGKKNVDQYHEQTSTITLFHLRMCLDTVYLLKIENLLLKILQ